MSTDIDTSLQAAVDRHELPGVVALATTASEVIYQGAFGRLRTDAETPMETDTLFNIMSMTKPVTSVAVMMLIEAGTIGLEDALADHLPDYKDMQVIEAWNPSTGELSTRPARSAITIRQLLSNTSGMGYAFCSPLLFSIDPSPFGLDLHSPLLHEPGERFTYGPSTRALGHLIAAVSGQPLDVFLRERIFTPLGMTDTGYDYTGKEARLASPHVWTMEGLKPTQVFPISVMGDGGLHSTAQDYARFLQCLLAGGAPLLQPESFSSMIDNQIGTLAVEIQPEGNPAMTRPFPNNAGADKFGLGFQLDNTDADGLRSKGSYSWSGLLNTHFWGDPVRGLGGIILMQVLPFYDPRCMALSEAFERGVYRL